MNTLNYRVVLALAAFASFSAAAATEETISKRLPAQQGGTLVVDVEFGSVEISTNATSEVTVDVWRKVKRGSKKDEEAFLRDRPVEILSDDGKFTVRSRAKTKKKVWNWGGGSTEGKYTISVPSQFKATINTAGGSVAVNGLTGNVDANTAGGSLKFGAVTGAINGNTAGGSVRVDKSEGVMKLHTSGGSIHVAGSAGSLEGETSGGSVKVDGFRGSAKVQTSGGSLVLEGMQGGVEGATSGGSIRTVFVGPVSDSVKLSSTGGGITVRIPADSALNLDAEAVGGNVHSDLPVTVVGKIERDKLKGTLNGGGKPVTLRSVGGSIHVEKL